MSLHTCPIMLALSFAHVTDSARGELTHYVSALQEDHVHR